MLSQRFSRPFTRSPLDLYRTLRTVNPSPYMFILETGDFALERVDNDRLQKWLESLDPDELGKYRM